MFVEDLFLNGYEIVNSENFGPMRKQSEGERIAWEQFEFYLHLEVPADLISAAATLLAARSR
jgi:hypothetical protein